MLVDRLRTDHDHFTRFIRSGEIRRDRLTLRLDPAALAEALSLDPEDLSPALLLLDAPLTLRRRGVETRIISGQSAAAPDAVLTRTLAKAHDWASSLRAGQSLGAIARAAGHSESYIRTRLPLAFLAPDLQRSILDGTQPADLTFARHLRDQVPLDWEAQRPRFRQHGRLPVPAGDFPECGQRFADTGARIPC